ncbi:MAG: hypothetical protein JO304_11475 [Solirubrobacterales bacterium]|nr:hypothetical protein [Solirubrobacterales bacterium]
MTNLLRLSGHKVCSRDTVRELPRQKHAVKPSAIAPVIAEFVPGLPVAAWQSRRGDWRALAPPL